jgi:hypothetical protein
VSGERLTKGQERFAIEVAGGTAAAEAYRRVYPKSRQWTDEALYVQATRAMQRPKVSLRVRELRARAEAEGIATLTEACMFATKIMRDDCERTEVRLSAMDRLARLKGWDKPATAEDDRHITFEVVRVYRGLPAPPPAIDVQSVEVAP